MIASLRFAVPILMGVSGFTCTQSQAWCETFVVREDDGNVAAVDARLYGEGRGMVAIERSDGRLEVIPQDQLVQRKPGPDPEPIACDAMIERLQQKFGADMFRAVAERPYVVGLVLSAPLPKPFEPKAAECLKKAVAFLKSVEKDFLSFTDDLQIETTEPRYPLVLLIFETDDDFLKYAQQETDGRGLSSGAMLGYYHALSNRLVIRMSECTTFTTPLHEAIHQQVFNRGLIQRLSPVPVWFHEGIATGFEGNGDKIHAGPAKVSARYGRMARHSRAVKWSDVVENDRAFRGDVLAGEAYAQAWGLHWLLLTRYRRQYVQYLERLREKSALQVDADDTRTREFESTFGKSIDQLQTEFPAWLEQQAKKQRVSLETTPPKARFHEQINLAELDLNGTESPIDGSLQVDGRLKNISLIRPMSFVVTIITNAGTYAEWYAASVPPQKVIQLPRRVPAKRLNGAPGGAATTYRVQVKAVVPDSETGRAWHNGQFEIPEWVKN